MSRLAESALRGMKAATLPKPVRGAIVDLDDTLHYEWAYAKSGIDAVARFLGTRISSPLVEIRAELVSLLEESRLGVLNRYLQRHDRCTPELAATLVHVYRRHTPPIEPFPDVVPALRQLRSAGFVLGLLTDGASVVQNSKIDALGLREHFDAVVCTDDIPGGARKPATLPYAVISELMNVAPQSLACLGDDRSKDFVGARALGMVTVRIARPLEHKLEPEANFDDQHEADVVVENLADAAALLLASGQAHLGPSAR